MLDVVLWILVGGLLGWLASLIMGTNSRQGLLLDILVGIIGAALAGWLISPLVGVPTINQGALSLGALLVSLVGAILLLGLVNVFRFGRAR